MVVVDYVYYMTQKSNWLMGAPTEKHQYEGQSVQWMRGGERKPDTRLRESLLVRIGIWKKRMPLDDSAIMSLTSDSSLHQPPNACPHKKQQECHDQSGYG